MNYTRDRFFVDTNLLVYAYDSSAGKKWELASVVISALWKHRTGIISTQVVQELFVALTQKVADPISPKKAKEIKGTRFIHIYAPCPTGWKSRPEDSIKLGRMVVQNCIFPLYEVENGEKYTLNIKPREKKPVNDYFRLQGRFRHLKEEDLKYIQEVVDHNWNRLLKLCEAN